jgi:MurNAc alpha-1-phosphate uridylyltransferase
MVDSPPQHPLGDFRLGPDGLLRARAEREQGLTYAGVGVFRPGWFEGLPADFAPLRPMLDRAVAAGRIGGERHAGEWEDVGTPERLRDLDLRVRARA